MARVKLGDVAREYKEVCKGSKDGLPVVGLEHITPEELTLSTWDDGKDNTFTKMFRKGQILFGRRRAYLKKAAIAPFDGICSGDITVIEAMPERILPDLLPFIIQNDRLFDYAVGKSAGSLSPRVKWEHLRDYSFELPSLNEQRALADILGAANAAKDAYKRLMAATDNLVKSQFIEMFGNVVTNEMNWLTKPLSVVAPEKQPVIESAEKVWLLNLDAIESDSGTIIERYYDNVSAIGSSTVKFDAHYVLYSKLRPYLNKVVLPDQQGYATSELVPLLPNDKHITRVFLAALLRSDAFVSYAVGLSGGARMPRVPMKEFREFPCILPPIELQERFAAFVESADKSKFALQQNIERLEMCRNALIQKAFS